MTEKKKTQTNDLAVTELTKAAHGLVESAEVEAWDYGWAYKDYRTSARAAFSGPTSSLTFETEALGSYESGVERLLREPQIRDRWSRDEIWSVVCQMLVAANAADSDTETFVTGAVSKLRTTEQSLIVLLVANVSWEGAPAILGSGAIGLAEDALITAIALAAPRGRTVPEDLLRTWLEDQVVPRRGEDNGSPVAAAFWCTGQQELVRREAQSRLQEILDLSLLLENDLRGHQVFRRGATNRPGVRGLVLDRGAIERGLSQPALIELSSRPFVASDLFPGRQNIQWYGVEPFPLGTLLGQRDLHAQVAAALGSDPVSGSLRVAARWFAEAHYAAADDDTALALGVALDALLTGKRSMPGSAMADRFALLSDVVEQRRDLVAKYLKLYGVRSSVAHGGRSSKLDDADLLDQFLDSVQWAAKRCAALRDQFQPISAEEIDTLFDELRWGMRVWPASESG